MLPTVLHWTVVASARHRQDCVIGVLSCWAYCGIVIGAQTLSDHAVDDLMAVGISGKKPLRHYKKWVNYKISK